MVLLCDRRRPATLAGVAPQSLLLKDFKGLKEEARECRTPCFFNIIVYLVGRLNSLWSPFPKR